MKDATGRDGEAIELRHAHLLCYSAEGEPLPESIQVEVASR